MLTNSETAAYFSDLLKEESQIIGAIPYSLTMTITRKMAFMDLAHLVNLMAWHAKNFFSFNDKNSGFSFISLADRVNTTLVGLWNEDQNVFIGESMLSLQKTILDTTSEIKMHCEVLAFVADANVEA